MKKLVLLVLLISAISCQKKAIVDYSIISGKIENVSGELSLNSADGSVKKVLAVSDDGTFSDTIRVDVARYLLYDGKNRMTVYLDKGNTININYDAANFDNTLLISGKGSEVSNYILISGKKEKELRGEGTSLYLLEEDEYKQTIEKIKLASEEILDATTGISEAFRTKERRNLNYAYLSQLSIYERYHAHYAEKPEFKTSEGFLNELDEVDYSNEEDFDFSQSYRDLLTSHFYDEAALIAKTDSLEEDIAVLKSISKSKSETIKNSLLFEYAKYGITYTGDFEEFYTIFMANSTNEANNSEITKSFNKLKSVAKGQPSPTFENYENFAGGTTSLSDLKGKYVYVDVWATWCGPCKREIPYLQKVEKQYEGKNIHFVSLSVDKLSDHDKWQKMVGEEQLGGIQLFADNSWKSSFVEEYLIKGIPRFILIDPKGDIVSSNAPRPSDTKLIDLFKELNI
ncbi:MAG: redoxin domain-containing protein [Lutibacter sp.]|uniref:TlpA family protein disulfide reductase n=1 Tax=Lutibacter sp. TaxID=1925666 RepID=UPI00178F44A9|nr:redoxin domain-containing protein [Lutibacter sp.]MBT8317378.1 redoxin domain-containing protein [Lutibacter sp.]NNJ58237.1 redoxin domain-containing protein [Lutibacter sp.]